MSVPRAYQLLTATSRFRFVRRRAIVRLRVNALFLKMWFDTKWYVTINGIFVGRFTESSKNQSTCIFCLFVCSGRPLLAALSSGCAQSRQGCWFARNTLAAFFVLCCLASLIHEMFETEAKHGGNSLTSHSLFHWILWGFWDWLKHSQLELHWEKQEKWRIRFDQRHVSSLLKGILNYQHIPFKLSFTSGITQAG